MSDSQPHQPGQRPTWPSTPHSDAPPPFISQMPPGMASDDPNAAPQDTRFASPYGSSDPAFNSAPPAFPGWGPPPAIGEVNPQQPPVPVAPPPQGGPIAQAPLHAASPVGPSSYPSAIPVQAVPPVQSAPPVQPVQPGSYPSASQQPFPGSYGSPVAPPPGSFGSPVAPQPGPFGASPEESSESTMLKSPVPPRQAPPPAKPKGSVVPLVGGLVGGLVLGLALGLGAHAAGLLPSAAPVAPKAIDVGADKFPSTLMGLTRVDLDGTPEGASSRAVAEAARDGLVKSYGGPGMQLYYGGGKASVASLWVQNGALAAPASTSDVQHVKNQNVSGVLELTGSPTTQCRTFGFTPAKLSATPSPADIEAAKKSIIDGRGDGTVICTRRDDARNVSVQISVQKWVDNDTRAQVATKAAEAVDQAFTAMTK